MCILLYVHQATISNWSVIPFVTLLLLLSTGSIIFPKFWHESYKMVSVSLGLVVAFWYIYSFKQTDIVIETFAEYVSFVALLFALYVAAGGIFIFADFESNTRNNILFLLIGAALANLIGTTGASVLLIRPFMRMNRYRLQPYHIVFFIFFVSNIGGLLTPIGDPPLFIGFLKGIPFFYTLINLYLPWILTLILLTLFLYWFESKNVAWNEIDISKHYSNKIMVKGKRNFIWLGLAVLTVFIDPGIIPNLPAYNLNGHKISFIREGLQILIACLCLYTANKKALRSNQFKYEPIREIAFLFFGIFMTMIPALQLLQQLGKNGMILNLTQTYFASGLASAFLDNAPAYLNFLTFSMGGQNLQVNQVNDVVAFADGSFMPYVLAISISSVFWGAVTYVGNGPNLMVKSIAEHAGVKMPSFFGYIFRYSIPILLPILILIWLVFF